MTFPRLTIDPVPFMPVPMLEVSGTLTLPDTPPLLAAVAASLSRPPHVLVCDVGTLEAPLTDAWLQAFPAALRRAGGWPHACLHLAGAGADLSASLRRSRIHRYLSLHATLDDAVAAASTEVSRTVHDLELPALTGSLHRARAALQDCGLRLAATDTASQDVVDTALLVITELVSNSIVHVGRPFTLSLAQSTGRLLVAVTDRSRDEPVLRARHPTATGGRGLRVVAGLSQAWGVRLVHPRGKTVWAALATSPGRPLVPRARLPLELDG